jgi:DNA-binding NtrC family response regulator
MVHSQPGRGTRFDLYFPEAEGPAGRSSSAPPFTTAGNGEMILVVDDDPDNVRTVRQIVLQLGYRAATFERATDALTAFSARPGDFAVVLTDLAMPVMNGLQFATQVRAVRSTTPLIIASGFFTEAEEREAAKLHLTRMIHKPLTVATLSEAVATALKSARS